MHPVTLVGALALAAVVMLSSPQTADAACCRSHNAIYCGDCTRATPYCGYGKCNIFGCSCKGGCRRGICRWGKRSVDEQSYSDAEELVSVGDLNGDGLLSIEEAETLLHPEPTEEHRRSVRSLDKNMDGMLTVDEIDE